MVNVITFHAAHEGVGTSTIAANVAALLSINGQRVGVIDANLHTPSMHTIFNLPQANIVYSFNDYLLGQCNASQMIYDITLPVHIPAMESIFLIPSSPDPSDFSKVLSNGYNVERITDDLRNLAERLCLDVLVIDTYHGMNEKTLLSLLCVAISDTLAIVMRLEAEDYQDTSVIVDVARTLDGPQIALIVNQVVSGLSFMSAKTRIEDIYGCSVSGMLPYADEIATLGSAGIFALRYPHHPTTRELKHLADTLTQQEVS